jgi:hypothetical protein
MVYRGHVRISQTVAIQNQLQMRFLLAVGVECFVGPIGILMMLQRILLG